MYQRRRSEQLLRGDKRSRVVVAERLRCSLFVFDLATLILLLYRAFARLEHIFSLTQLQAIHGAFNTLSSYGECQNTIA